MIDGNKLALGLALGVFSLMASGCGCGGRELPELGYVTGTVTMDGRPLMGVGVRFHPEDGQGGRSAVGITDDEGYYELKYVGNVEGTRLGHSKVSVTTQWPDGEPGDGEFETIPAIYNGKNSTLTADVVAGNNTIDFSLVSQ